MNLLRVAAAACICVLLASCSQSATNTPVLSPVGSAPGAGTSGINAPIAVTAKPRFAYTGNQSASVSGFSVNSSSGALTPLNAFPLSIGTNPTSITHDPQNRFVIVTDIASYTLFVLAINASTGALTPVGPYAYATIKEPVSSVIDPAGTHLFVSSQGGNQVAAYSISATGILTPAPGSPFTTGKSSSPYSIGATSVLTSAAGTMLYLQDVANIYTYAIDTATGALSPLQTVAGPGTGFGIALDPNGNYLYAVGAGTDAIFSYSISSTTGLLSLAKTSPMAEPNGAYTIAVSPSSQFAYTIENNNDLVTYSIDNGVFTQVGSARPGFFGLQIGIDPSGSFLYVPNACSGSGCTGLLTSSVSEFSIASSGALTLISGSPVTAGSAAWGITITSQ